MRGVSDTDFKSNKGAVVLRLPSGLEVHRRVDRSTNPMTVFSRPKAFNFGGVDGHLYVIRKHALVVVQRRGPNKIVNVAPDATLDSAAFVGVDGRSLWLTAPSGTEPFTLVTSPLPVESPIFTGGNQWRAPVTPEPAILDGVLEAAALICFW